MKRKETEDPIRQTELAGKKKKWIFFCDLNFPGKKKLMNKKKKKQPNK